jgi:hypothetical protein
LELVERTPYLQPRPTAQLHRAVHPHQRAELAVEVHHVEVARVELDFGVHAGDADVLESYFALVSASHLDGVLVFGADDVEAAFLPALLALVDALEDEVGQSGLVDGDHLHRVAGFRPGDHARERLLADLALELGEVVGHHHARHLLLHLAVDPHLQAQHVHALAGTLALARRNQEVVRRAVVAQAELAAPADRLARLVHPVEFPQEQLPLLLAAPGNPSDLHHAVLHSAQLHDVAQSCLSAHLLNGNP